MIDAFASEPLQGNPVAVFFDCDDLSGERMQRMAREMNLSESTFVLRRNRTATRASASSPRSTNCRSPATAAGHRHRPGRRDRQGQAVPETRMGTVPFALERPGRARWWPAACSSRSPPGSTSAARPSCSPPSA
ncbi:PhzF family phenazine biosynthesis protein [Pseudomonas aeruginosa]|uniref:PhzF family phenazine biosynthesis protein n=1 Tax=Pseudomonas aeruginosa TaxID=287 RepID=UPI0034601F3A